MVVVTPMDLADLDLPLPDVTGSPLADLLHPDSAAPLDEVLRRLLAAPGERFTAFDSAAPAVGQASG